MKDSYDKLRVYLIESRKASKLFAFWFVSIQAALCFLFIAFEIIEGLCDIGFLSSYYPLCDGHSLFYKLNADWCFQYRATDRMRFSVVFFMMTFPQFGDALLSSIK